MGVRVEVQHSSGLVNEKTITTIGQAIHYRSEELNTALGLVANLIFARQRFALVFILYIDANEIIIACQKYVGPSHPTNPTVKSQRVGDGFCYRFTPDIGGPRDDFAIIREVTESLALAHPQLCSREVKAALGLALPAPEPRLFTAL